MTDDLERRRRAYEAAQQVAQEHGLEWDQYGDQQMLIFEKRVAAWHAAGGRLPQREGDGDVLAVVADNSGIALGVSANPDGMDEESWRLIERGAVQMGALRPYRRQLVHVPGGLLRPSVETRVGVVVGDG